MRRLIIVVAAIAVLTAACGSDDTADTTTTEAPSTTLAATTTQAPTTTEPIATTTTTEAPVETPTTPVMPGEDPDADEIVALFAVIFDSATAFEDRTPLIDDPAGLETAIAGYQSAGDAVGGIFLDVKETGVVDDLAAVVYDLQFGGNPFQTDQPGEAINVDGSWLVTRPG